MAISVLVAVEPVADPQRGHAGGDLFDQGIGDGLDGDEDADGHAAFPGGTEAGVDGGVGGQFEVGVGQDQHVVLGTAEGLDALAVPGRGLVDVLRDRR
jgi:hypothetical protein